MRFQHVRIAAVAHVLPDERVRSDELEERLAPLYDRLNLRVGRLELMSGIAERRFWPRGTRPSAVAARAGALALERGGVAREAVGCLVHASVSRDFLEPATAAVVHARLELPAGCQIFDLSNACLGMSNALVVVASMIEQGALEAGLVVAGEDGRPLVEQTIAQLLADDEATRADLKRAFASLTIGSGAAAILLERVRAGRTSGRLLGGAALAASEHHALCTGDRQADAHGPLMSTDAEALLAAGNALAARTFERFLAELGWTRASIERIVTHQVGTAHRRTLFEALALDPARDFPTFATLGNSGSASWPTTLSLALEAGSVRPGERVACLGIGSGLNCLMLGLQW